MQDRPDGREKERLIKPTGDTDDPSADHPDPPCISQDDDRSLAELLRRVAHISLGGDDARAPDLLSGRRLGPWLLRERLGAGGWGVVYRAEHHVLHGRTVALKLLRGRHGERQRQILEREARNAYRVQHANVAQIHDMSEAEGTAYVVMELVEGEPLGRLIAESRMDARRALHYARQLAEGVAAAHRVGVIHRDLSPGNVMVDRHGNVKILDFGVSKAAHEGMQAEPPRPSGSAGTLACGGTPGYIAPELEQGEAADARSDVFSAGCVLRRMLLACPRDLRHARLISGMEAVVARCTAPRPADRYPSGVELAAALTWIAHPSRWRLAWPALATGGALTLLLASMLTRPTRVPAPPRAPVGATAPSPTPVPPAAPKAMVPATAQPVAQPRVRRGRPPARMVPQPGDMRREAEAEPPSTRPDLGPDPAYFDVLHPDY